MNDIEYAARRSILADQVLDHLITVVGNALPHTRFQLEQMLDAWQRGIDELNAECRKAEKPEAA